MEDSETFTDQNTQNIGKVATDAAHRRFVKNGKSNTVTNKIKEKDKETGVLGDDFYYCKQCKNNISALRGTEELKTHFNNIKHMQYSACVYCSKPVYEYRRYCSVI